MVRDVPKKTTPEEDAAAQSARVMKAARELGCDESLGAFEAAVKKVALQKPVEEIISFTSPLKEPRTR